MLFSIPLWILLQLINLIVLLPLSLVGSFITNTWTVTMVTGLQFVLRPVLYLQAFINIPIFMASIGWCMGVVTVWIGFLAVKFVWGLIRGHNSHFNPRSAEYQH